MLIKHILIIGIFLILACKGATDYSGTFSLDKGPCKSSKISLKKVSGFGDKYYLVKTFSDAKSSGREFLGVIKGNEIKVNGTIITLDDKSLQIKSRDKTCIYIRQN